MWYTTFEVERILRKRITPKGRVLYLIRWLSYGPEDDVWRAEKQLADCKELVAQFEAATLTQP